MFVLNTTFHVHTDIGEDFSKWVREDYIPSAIKNGLLHPCFMRLMLEVQADCTSYAVSLKARRAEDAVRWHDNEGAELRRNLYDSFGDKVVFFTTCMEELSIN